ncbi:MAG: hypothetical protein ACK4I8_06205 [Armatimonadota bacterium]
MRPPKDDEKNSARRETHPPKDDEKKSAHQKTHPKIGHRKDFGSVGVLSTTVVKLPSPTSGDATSFRILTCHHPNHVPQQDRQNEYQAKA